MKTLAGTFTDAAAQKIEESLFRLADGLSRTIEHFTARYPQGGKLTLSFPVPGLGDEDPTQLSGYKRLHRICADADVQISLVAAERGLTAVSVALHQPYSASPDAGIGANLPPEPRSLLLRPLHSILKDSGFKPA